MNSPSFVSFFYYFFKTISQFQVLNFLQTLQKATNEKHQRKPENFCPPDRLRELTRTKVNIFILKTNFYKKKTKKNYNKKVQEMSRRFVNNINLFIVRTRLY